MKLSSKDLKYKIHRHFRHVYNVTLTQAQLDDIHEMYHHNNKQWIWLTITYRFIYSGLFTFTGAIVWFAEGHELKTIGFIVWGLALYQLLIGIKGMWTYHSIEDPNRPSDE